MEYEDKKFNPTKVIILILIGGAVVILSELFIFGGLKKVVQNYSDEPLVNVASLRDQHDIYMGDGIYIEPSMISKPKMPPVSLAKAPVISHEDEISITIDEILANQNAVALANIMPAVGVDKEIYEEQEQEQEVEKEAYISDNVVTYEYESPKGQGMIAIIIDDMGISLRSKLVEVLPSPLTLSYLPYAKNLKERTARAAANGHELMVHIPMEPMNEYMDGGPKVLKTSSSDDDLTEILGWALSQFDGFKGVNNHMGSKLTQDENAMRHVMEYLKRKDDGLFFIDSKTIGSSIAAKTARDMGVPYAARDIFLDHEQTPEFIAEALAKLEAAAHKNGYAIAIGHPHKETIAALKAWLPTLKDKGLTLVPASKLINQPKPANDDMVAGR